MVPRALLTRNLWKMEKRLNKKFLTKNKLLSQGREHFLIFREVHDESPLNSSITHREWLTKTAIHSPSPFSCGNIVYSSKWQMACLLLNHFEALFLPIILNLMHQLQQAHEQSCFHSWYLLHGIHDIRSRDKQGFKGYGVEKFKGIKFAYRGSWCHSKTQHQSWAFHENM